MRRDKPVRITEAITIAFICLAGFASFSAAAGNAFNLITAVKGESWLTHLHKTLAFSSMGMTWSLGPPALPPFEKYADWQMSLSSDFPPKRMTLSGSDIYRLNCRGCHQESGRGSPPEINSIIAPVRATSVEAIMQRMKDRGLDMSRTDAAAMASQASDALLDRLHKGGEDMPAFSYLGDLEIHALIVYLRQLAGVPGADKQLLPLIEENPLHIGEQIVKSNCHICHGATGLNPTPQQLYDGAIPPLRALTTRKGMPEFVRKVTEGLPVTMGKPGEVCRGRMSVFYYLSQDEAASGYLYLSTYPPQE